MTLVLLSIKQWHLKMWYIPPLQAWCFLSHLPILLCGWHDGWTCQQGVWEFWLALLPLHMFQSQYWMQWSLGDIFLMNLWEPIRFWRTGPCWIHSSIDVIIHSHFCHYVLQAVNQLCFMCMGGIWLDGSICGSIFLLMLSCLSITINTIPLSALSIMWSLSGLGCLIAIISTLLRLDLGWCGCLKTL